MSIVESFLLNKQVEHIVRVQLLNVGVLDIVSFGCNCLSSFILEDRVSFFVFDLLLLDQWFDLWCSLLLLGGSRVFVRTIGRVLTLTCRDSLRCLWGLLNSGLLGWRWSGVRVDWDDATIFEFVSMFFQQTFEFGLADGRSKVSIV